MTTKDNLYEYLNTFGISALRSIARAEGVSSPTTKSKEELIEELIAIETGKVEPIPRSNRGAPVKDSVIDPEVLARLHSFRPYPVVEQTVTLSVHTAITTGGYDSPCFFCSGYLSKREEEWRLVKDDKPLYMLTGEFVAKNDLREGDLVALSHAEDGGIRLAMLNGFMDPKPRPRFLADEPIYPSERLTLGAGGQAMLRWIDLFCPVTKGGRLSVSIPPRTGKIPFISTVLSAYPSAVLLSVDAAPEEVRAFSRFPGPIFLTTFDEDDQAHRRIADLAIEHAKRRCEMGENVLLLIDSLSALALVYGEGREGTNAVRKIFASARCLKNGGSLTIVGITPSMEDEFTMLSGAYLLYSKELSWQGVEPPFDPARSGAIEEEALLSPEELAFVRTIRLSASDRKAYQNFAKIFSSYRKNAEVIEYYSIKKRRKKS
ncbi:MAG: hypothetical protein ACI4U2_06510 [Christensenellaceae bacterium]